MKNLLLGVFIILFIAVIVFLIVKCFKNQSNFNNNNNNNKYKNFHIVCAKYDKNTDFLNKINIKNTIIKKKIDVMNNGFEASSYIYYIIKNYNKLPDNIIFIHDENKSWHHKGMLSNVLYKHIDYYNNNNLKYYNFNDKKLSINILNKEIDNKFFDKFWNECMYYKYGSYKNIEVNDNCCSQFIVNKNNILQHDKLFYINIFNWIKNNTIDNNDSSILNSNYHVGRFLEYTWNIIFKI